MKCFYHENSEAVGICKHCSKGICSKCIINSDFGITCSENCKLEINKLYKKITATSSSFNKLSVFFFLCAIACAFFGITESDSTFMLIFSGIFLIGSFMMLLIGKKTK